MKDSQLYNKITDNTKNMTFEANNYNNIIHFILNYIDDSSNIMGRKSNAVMKTYVENYLKVFEEFHYLQPHCLL